MKVRFVMTVTAVILLTITSADALPPETTTREFLLNREGGAVEVGVKDPKDALARDTLRQQLRQIPEKFSKGDFATPVFNYLETPAMRRHRKDITYRYQKTARGGRIRIAAKNRDALQAVQDFLRSQGERAGSKAVTFTFVPDTALVVVPVYVNDHGPYRFLLDTGASNSILSAVVADSLQIRSGRTETLLTAGGNVPVTLRTLETLQLGDGRLNKVEIAVANIDLLQTLQVDGILGGDYLRRFKVSIDYDSQIVQIEPCCPESMSMLAA